MRMHQVLLGATAVAACLMAVGCGSAGYTTVLPSGIRYTDTKVGEGEPAQYSDTVVVHYIGRLTDGTVVDERMENSPLVLKLGMTAPFPALNEGIAGMRRGGKRQLYVPAALGFGKPGRPPRVPPNADLILDMELIKLQTAEQMEKEIADAQTRLAGLELPEKDRKEITTVGGVKCIDIRPGDGAEVGKDSTVVVHYVGKLRDGSEFDSSLKRKQPFSAKLGSGQVIPGWDEGLVGMKEGGKRRIIIPPALAYGAKARPGIPANSELTFDIDLLKVR